MIRLPKKEELPSLTMQVKATCHSEVTSAQTVEQAGKKIFRLLHFHELEEWRRDNEWIWTGYRQSEASYISCLKSLFFLHNETGNVYSHLIGALVFIGICIYTYGFVLHDAHLLDIGIFSCFLLGAVSCLALSALFHLFCCHSADVSLVWNRCDYLGITFMIVGSAYPAVYYAFHCEPYLQAAYLSILTIFGIITIPFVVMKKFAQPEYRHIRALLFVGLGVSAGIPLPHAIYQFGWHEAIEAGALEYMAVMAMFYLVGALLYALRIPERHFPGKFDYWLHSHQIFHLCVVLAALVHYIGLLDAYSWHQSNTCSTRSSLTLRLVHMVEEAFLNATAAYAPSMTPNADAFLHALHTTFHDYCPSMD